MTDDYLQHSVEMLRRLVAIRAFSGSEQDRSNFVSDLFSQNGITVQRVRNNIIVRQPHHNDSRPTLMLNSHLDTVMPAETYSFDPFQPPLSETHVYGLGSNDAGASVVCMTQAFLHFYRRELPFNVMLVLSCEEENSGPNGMKMLADNVGADFAIIGEPTGMKAAIAERGLLVLDGLAEGVSGHAARDEGVNAIYIALRDIETMRTTVFDKISPTMGAVKLTVTQIEAGRQHNVVPDRCSFVVDIRPTDVYTNAEILNLLSDKVSSRLTARSLTNESSATPPEHLLMKAIKSLQLETYTSPTTSDWMRVHCPAVKMGPGESARSHQADEFVLVDELRGGIEGYIRFVNAMIDEQTLIR